MYIRHILPRVSVVMANFNKGAYLEFAIKSVLDQSLEDFELIIVDSEGQDG